MQRPKFYDIFISVQVYDHRSGDPCSVFSYDRLDRLTLAEYGIDDSNEVFDYDKLGNRETVNLRSGSDANNNWYVSIASNDLSYDAAGNLTTDGDGYEYEYDYENRMVRIAHSNRHILAKTIQVGKRPLFLIWKT